MKRFVEEARRPFQVRLDDQPRIDCSQSPLDVRLAPEECVALDLADRKRSGMDPVCRRSSPRDREEARHGPPVPVRRRRELVCRRPLRPSEHLRAVGVGAVRHPDREFPGRLGTFLHQQRLKKITRPTKCVACTLKAVCGMCPANGELENGDPEAPVDWLCQVAHLRAHSLELPVPTHGDCEYCPGGSAYEALMNSAGSLRKHGTSNG